jgi:hypothetical protein
MSASSIVMVAPRLPPAIDGVGDFCRRLWESWPGEPPPWSFLVLSGADESRRAWPEVEVRPFEANEGSLFATLTESGADIAALQYVGYGFDSQGHPGWLAAALQRWRAQASGRRLVVMFHELWGSGPPWTRAFWTHPAQVRVAAELCRTADAALVSTATARDLLAAKSGGMPELAPIPSNIPVLAPCWRDARLPNRLRVLVFGMEHVRRAALSRHRHLIAALSDAGQLAELVIAGPASEPPRPVAPGVRVESHGALSAPEVSRLIGSCHVSLCATPAHLVCKSGTAMAAMAHGCAVVAWGTKDAWPLAADEQLFVGAVWPRGARGLADRLTSERVREVGLQGRRWYEEHADWRAAAEIWTRHLAAPSRSSGIAR